MRVAGRLRHATAETGSTSDAANGARARATELEGELKRVQATAAQRAQENAGLSHSLESSRRAAREMVSADAHAALAAKLRKRAARCGVVERQIGELRAEMAKLLESYDARQHSHSDLERDLELSSDENEALRGALAGVHRELGIAESFLNDRTKQLLALERRDLPNKARVVVVRDAVPLDAGSSRDPPPDMSHCIGEAMRNGLCEMQARLMKREELVWRGRLNF